MKSNFIIIALFALGTANAQEASILVSAQWLKEHQKDPGVVILHVNNMRLDYEQEHIEGAAFYGLAGSHLILLKVR